MRDLRSFTTQQLRKELERRDKRGQPTMVAAPDFTKVMDLTEQYIDNLAHHVSDADHERHIFEEVVEACYGEHVWEWINERLG